MVAPNAGAVVFVWVVGAGKVRGEGWAGAALKAAVAAGLVWVGAAPNVNPELLVVVAAIGTELLIWVPKANVAGWAVADVWGVPLVMLPPDEGLGARPLEKVRPVELVVVWPLELLCNVWPLEVSCGVGPPEEVCPNVKGAAVLTVTEVLVAAKLNPPTKLGAELVVVVLVVAPNTGLKVGVGVLALVVVVVAEVVGWLSCGAEGGAPNWKDGVLVVTVVTATLAARLDTTLVDEDAGVWLAEDSVPNKPAIEWILVLSGADVAADDVTVKGDTVCDSEKAAAAATLVVVAAAEDSANPADVVVTTVGAASDSGWLGWAANETEK